MSASDSRSFGDVVGRLDDIVEEVRGKDTTLERSLDLLDEAIDLGVAAIDLVESREFSAAELAAHAAGDAADEGDATGPDASDVATTA